MLMEEESTRDTFTKDKETGDGSEVIKIKKITGD